MRDGGAQDSGVPWPTRPTAAARKGRVFLTMACVLLLAGAADLASAAERVSLQLRWVHQFQFAGYYVAKARGYYADAGLDVDIRSGGPGTTLPIDAVTSGLADFGVSNSGLAAARMNDRPVVALAAVLQQSASIWLSRPGITSPEQVGDAARQQAMALRDSDESIELLVPFARWRSASGPLQFSPTNYSLDAFIQGKTDLYSAYRSNELFTLNERGISYAIIDPRQHGADFYGDVLFTSERMATRRADTVRRFRDATLKGWRAAFADIDGTVRLIRQLYSPDRSEAQLSFEGHQLRALSGYGQVEVGHMSASRWLAIADTLRGMGIGRTELKANDFMFDMRQTEPSARPDPVRVSLVGSTGAAFICLVLLVRRNRKLVVEAEVWAQRQADHLAAELRFQFLMSVAPFPVLIITLSDGRVVYANERALAWLMIDDSAAQPALGNWLPQLAPEAPALLQLREGRMIRDAEFEIPSTGSGRPSRWCMVTVRPVEYEGKACGFATLSDISSRKHAELELKILNEQRGVILAEVEQLQSRLRETALRDPLTGLFNRRYLDGTLSREWARCQREGAPMSLLVIDVDHFKSVNDRHGHAIGDEVLRALAASLLAVLRSSDVACRFGGEEFVILMPGADEHVALVRAETLRQTVESRPVRVADATVAITVSIGVASAMPGDSQPEDLFPQADAAVYVAKRTGRNRVELARRLADRQADARRA